MKKTISIFAALALLAAIPAYAENTDPETGHGSVQDDHSKIEALNVSPEEAVTTLESGLSDLMTQIEASAAEDVVKNSYALMSAVKTLQEANPSDRQAAALKQLDGQLDAAKHAGEEKNMAEAASATTKAQSALKLYKAVK